MADYTVALGVKPLQLENPLTMYGTVANIQNAQNQNALAQYTLAAARRGEESENALNKAYMEAYNPQTGQIDLPTLRSKIASAGVGSKLPAIEKQLAEVEKEQLARQEQFGKLVNQKFDQSKGLLSNVRTPEDYIAWHEANHADPVLGKYLASRGVTAESSRAQIMSELAQPGGLERLIARSATALDKMPALLEQERTQSAFKPIAPQAVAAPVTNAMVPATTQAPPVVNAMVSPVQTTAVPAPVVAVTPFELSVIDSAKSDIYKIDSQIANLEPNKDLPAVRSEINNLNQQKSRLLNVISSEQERKATREREEKKALKPEALPADVQSYEYARSQGYTGTYTQWVKDKATWGRAPAQPPAPTPLQQAFDTKTNSQVFVDRADIRANPDRYKPLGAEEKLKNIPETINKALTGNAASISQFDKAIDAASKNPSAIGLKGNLPQTILNKADPQGVETRALITDIGSAIVHDRSGAAVAASERPGLVPFIPQATDDSETAIKKLKQLKAKVQADQSGILDFYSQEQGYKPSLYHKQQNAPAEPAAPAAAKPAAVDIGSLPPKVTKNGKTYVLQPSGKYIEQ